AERQVAVSGELAAESAAHLNNQTDLAPLLSVEAYHTASTLQARGSLLSAANYSPALIAFLHGQKSSVYSVAFSPDGKLLAAGGLDGTIQLWDVARRKALGAPLTGHNNSVGSVAFSPNGKLLAS